MDQKHTDSASNHNELPLNPTVVQPVKLGEKKIEHPQIDLGVNAEYTTIVMKQEDKIIAMSPHQATEVITALRDLVKRAKTFQKSDKKTKEFITIANM